MSMQSIEAALAEVEKGSDEPASSTTPPPLTTREMASVISAELGIEEAPLTELVERASAMLGLEFGEEPLIERLRTVHEEVLATQQLASIPVDELDGDAEALKPFMP